MTEKLTPASEARALVDHDLAWAFGSESVADHDWERQGCRGCRHLIAFWDEAVVAAREPYIENMQRLAEANVAYGDEIDRLNEARAEAEATIADHSDPRYRPLMLAVRAADEAFQTAGDAGTKTWLDDYFLPELAKHGLTITALAATEAEPVE